MRLRFGLTMLEVMIALVILGVVATLFAQTTRMTRQMAGKSENWDQEGIAIESALENLRVDYSLPALRALDSTWTDARGQFRITMHARGSTPTDADCPGYPVTRLAKVVLTARRANLLDSLQTTTFLLVP
ncbi:MAG: prepilin-type N-terminal cleavage/methylation domain-containing protein [Fibrobacteria bacterium]|nr:prepilin-type N-terminal cleavage/methylation domain-containing protein [Fibrobacteria bacterium]